MNYYFAPNIPQLQTRLTLSNYSPVGMGEPAEKICVYNSWTDGEKWHVQQIGKLDPGDSKSFSVSDRAATPSTDSILLYFLFPEGLGDSLESLPVRPDVLSTVPEWRANIQLCSPTTSVSYQGEYPDSMLGIPKGSLVSVGPMDQESEGVFTKLILTNIRSDPRMLIRTLVLRGLKTGRIYDTFEVKTNHCNVLDLTGGVRLAEEPTCLLSPDMAGIPVYFSHDSEYQFMSLEHTHPPISLTLFGDARRRMEMVRKMKQYWLKSLVMEDCSLR